VNRPRISITCEKPGWICHRLAVELKNRLRNHHVFINEPVRDADINYFIDYSHYSKKSRAIDIGLFTHFEADNLGETWGKKIKELDYCIAQSESSKSILLAHGVPEKKISVVIPGADSSFVPKVRVGILGRIYPSGRKGERLVKRLLEDAEIMNVVSIVSKHEGWGAPVNDLEYQDFYNSIDFLLIPSLVEGGPVPFIEALACGKLAIAPPIGYARQFDHIEYKTGDFDDLKRVLLNACKPLYEERRRLSQQVKRYDWDYWATEHERVFNMLYEEYSKDRPTGVNLTCNPDHTKKNLLNEIGELEERIRQLEASLERIRGSLAYKIYSKTIRPLKNRLKGGA
jgi:glycosyltransferase involved in cell wall biosynthesis